MMDRARTALEQYMVHGEETGRELRSGSYGSVVEVNCLGLKCAGEKLHPSLYEDHFAQRLEGECELLSRLRHPNVAQFIGIYFDPDTNAPVLVMEYLTVSLAQYLDRFGGVVCEEIYYSILQHVSLGLRYLHERPHPIIHRDLSAHNVLLTPDMMAKVSYTGVVEILSPVQLSNITRSPQSQAYQSSDTTTDDIKIDVFSFGVLMIHILNGQWPVPTHQDTQLQHSNDPGPLSEFDCRKDYIKVKEGHPLMNLITRCLNNSPDLRPTVSEIHQQISTLADSYPLSAANRVEMLSQIEAISIHIGIEGKKGDTNHLHQINAFTPKAKLVQMRCADLPFGTDFAKAVVIDSDIYVGGGGIWVVDEKQVQFLMFKYNTTEDKWTVLPPTPVNAFGLGCLKGNVLIIGGILPSGVVTGDVLTLDDNSKQWVSSIPAMPTARCALSVVCHSSALITCGGNNNAYRVYSCVEIYRNETSQWYYASSLPFPREWMSCTLLHNTCYLMGGGDSRNSSGTRKTVVYASVSELIDSCHQSRYRSRHASNPWHHLSADNERYYATAACLSGCLLALGGKEEKEKIFKPKHFSSEVDVYNPLLSSWVHFGDLCEKCYGCSAVPLPTGELMVFGGFVPGQFSTTSAVYKYYISASDY